MTGLDAVTALLGAGTVLCTLLAVLAALADQGPPGPA